MAAPAAARPSRRFLVGAGLVLLVAVAIVNFLAPGGPAVARDPDPPDVWQKDGSQGDLRMAPDGPPLAGWWFAGFNDGGSGPGGKPRPMIVLGIEGRQQAPALRGFIDNRLRGDPLKWQRERGDRNLWRTDDPVDTPSGRWWRYSTRWWKGARPPGELQK